MVTQKCLYSIDVKNTDTLNAELCNYVHLSCTIKYLISAQSETC